MPINNTQKENIFSGLKLKGVGTAGTINNITPEEFSKFQNEGIPENDPRFKGYYTLYSPEGKRVSIDAGVTEERLAQKLEQGYTKTPTPIQSGIASQSTQNVLGSQGATNSAFTAQSVADLEKQKRINELERAYQQSIGKLQSEEEKAIQGFETGRSQTRTQGMMNAKAFEDYLAQKGISTSGTAPQGFIQQQGQLQGALGASQRQQQQFSTDIGRQRADLASQLEFGKAQSEIDTQIINAQEAKRIQALQEQRAYEERLMQMGWTREDAVRESERQYSKEVTAEERAYQEKLMQMGWTREDAIRESDRQFRTQETAEQRAYEERLMQMGWTREDAIRESNRAYEESLMEKGWSREDAIRESNRAYEATLSQNEQARADFQNTIMANYNDLQAFANRLVSQGAPQWQIDAVLAARQQKIAEQGLDQQGRPIQTGPTQDQWNNAYKKWNSGIPLTQQEMQILGTNVAVQPKTISGGNQRTTTVTQDRSFQEDRWKRLGKADEQIAQTWGVPVGTPYNSQITQEPADITPYQNFIENNFVTKATDMSPRTVNRMGITRYIYGLIEDNKFAEADLLASIYGITDSEFDAIETSLGNQRR